MNQLIWLIEVEIRCLMIVKMCKKKDKGFLEQRRIKVKNIIEKQMKIKWRIRNIIWSFIMLKVKVMNMMIWPLKTKNII